MLQFPKLYKSAAELFEQRQQTELYQDSSAFSKNLGANLYQLNEKEVF